MTNSEYKDFMKSLATSHKAVRHNEENEEYPTGNRRSFFRDPEEYAQSQLTQIEFPVMIALGISGKLSSSDDMEVYNNIFPAFEILKACENSQATVEIDEAYGQCYQVAEDMIAKIMDLFENVGHAGPIHDFNVNSVRYEYMNRNNHYGVRFLFETRKGAFNTTDVDLSEKFI